MGACPSDLSPSQISAPGGVASMKRTKDRRSAGAALEGAPFGSPCVPRDQTKAPSAATPTSAPAVMNAALRPRPNGPPCVPSRQETVAVEEASDVAPGTRPPERGVDSTLMPLPLDRGFAPERPPREGDAPSDIWRRLADSPSIPGGGTLASRIVWAAAGTEIGSIRPEVEANGRSAAMSSFVV